MKRWKEFELLVAKIHAGLAADAQVNHNQKVVGKSGRVRQLDVTFSKVIGIYPIFVVIECKQYKKPVGIEKVEAFVTKLNDVGASLGVIISTKGFDEGARASAKLHRIVLLSYQEANVIDWQETFNANSWVTLTWNSTRILDVYAVSSGQPIAVEPVTVIYLPSTDETGDFSELAKEVLSMTELPESLGDFISDFEFTPPLLFKKGDTILSFEKVIIKGRKMILGLPVNLTFVEGHVIVDDLEKEVILQQYVTESFDWTTIADPRKGIELSQEDIEHLKNSAIGAVNLPSRKSEQRIGQLILTHSKKIRS